MSIERKIEVRKGAGKRVRSERQSLQDERRDLMDKKHQISKRLREVERLLGTGN